MTMRWDKTYLTYKDQSTSMALGLFFSIFSPGVTSLGLDLCILGTLGVYSQMNYRFFLITCMSSDDLGVHCLMKSNSPNFSVQHNPGLAV